MMAIWKFSLKPGQQTIEMPAGAKLLSVAVQHEPQLWALVTPDNPLSAREIAVVGTGHELPPRAASWQFIGTLLLHDGLFVAHVFEITT